MIKNRKIFLVALVAIVVIATFYVPISFRPLNMLITKTVEKKLDAKVACRSIQLYLWRAITVDGFKATNKSGLTVYADKASVEYDLLSILNGRLHAKCALSGVKFYKGGRLMRSLSDILHIEPLDDMVFEIAKADIFIGWRDTVTHNLVIKSDNINISGNALTDIENNINCFLCFSFNDKLTGEIPSEIKGSILKRSGAMDKRLHRHYG